MKRIAARLVLLGAGLALLGAVGLAQTAPKATGHWQGKIEIPNHELGITVDLARSPKGVWIGAMSVLGSAAVDVPLSGITVEDTAVRFTAGLPGHTSFDGHLSADGSSLAGTVTSQAGEAPFQLTRSGEANVKVPPPSSKMSKDFEGKWEATVDADGKVRRIGLKLSSADDATATATLIAEQEIPVTTVTIKDKELQLEVRAVSGTYRGTLDATGDIAGWWEEGPKRVSVTFKRASTTSAVDNPIERWENAVGGRDKVAAIKSIYREATLEYGGFQGTIKVWHTADGKYRKEEQIATFSSIETFDGVNGTVQQGATPPRQMAFAELEQATSKRFANSNAMFFVFFPERRRGSVAIEGDGTIVFKPEGGIEWRVALDLQTSLPKAMVHKEGDRTITVTFDSYETVDGIKFEKEIHRSAGDPSRGAVIRFTKTVINPPVDASLFAGSF